MNQSERPRTRTTAQSEPLLSIAEAAEYFGVGERFVRRLINERRIPFVRIGRFIRFERSALDAFIAAGRVPNR